MPEATSSTPAKTAPNPEPEPEPEPEPTPECRLPLRRRRTAGIAAKDDTDLAGFESDQIIKARCRDRRYMGENIAGRAHNSEMLAMVMLKPIVLINKDRHAVVFPRVTLGHNVAAEDFASWQRSPLDCSVSNASRRSELW